MEGGSFSNCGYRLGAAHISLNKLQELHGLRAGRFQNVALVLAPRTFVLNNAGSSRIPMISVPEKVFRKDSGLYGL
eukprot:1784491-Pyramimonas_sp.AAC.1